MDPQIRLQELESELERLEGELIKLRDIPMEACKKDHLRSFLERQIAEVEIEREDLVADKEVETQY